MNEQEYYELQKIKMVCYGGYVLDQYKSTIVIERRKNPRFKKEGRNIHETQSKRTSQESSETILELVEKSGLIRQLRIDLNDNNYGMVIDGPCFSLELVFAGHIERYSFGVDYSDSIHSLYAILYNFFENK